MNIVTLKNGFESDKQDEVKEETVRGKVIRKSSLARQILAEGKRDVWLFDIKPDRDNPQRTVYIFEDTDKFQQVFSKVLEQNKSVRDNKSSKENNELRHELEEMQRKFDELKRMTENINANIATEKE